MNNANGPSEAAAQVVEIREAYERAEAEGRFDLVADHVADDFVALPLGITHIEGRELWAEKSDKWMADAAERGYSIRYHSSETLVGADLVVDWGTATDEGAGDDGERAENKYNYLMTYQRRDDAEVELARII